MKEFKSFFKQVGGNEGSLCHYNTRLDTYGCGCSHDCKYCYAKSLLEFRGLWNAAEPSVADPEKVIRKIERLKGKSIVLRLGGMTDCFQPIEKKYGVSHKVLEALRDNDIEYLIVTKSSLIATDEYMDVLEKGLAHIQITITATDDKVAAMYEKASPISERIRAIEKLSREGYDVSIRLSPYIPQYVDVKKINEIDCEKILVEFLRCNAFIRKTFPIDYSDFTLRHGNYWHLPLEKKLELLEKITINQKSVCDDVPEHYAYFQEHVNFNPNDCCNLRR